MTVQRLADATGTICVAKQRIGCGRVFARQTLTVHVSDTTITIELGDGDKSHRPPHHHDGAHYHQVQAATNGQKNLALLTHINWHKKEAHQPSHGRQLP